MTTDFDVLFFDESATKMQVEFSTDALDFTPGFQAVTIVTETWGDGMYEGPYETTPTVGGFSLPTAQKCMEQDVTIRPIPFYNVTNPIGGNTIYIASEV